MTNQVKIKTAKAKLVSTKATPVKLLLPLVTPVATPVVTPIVDHNEIAKKASASFLTALGSPRNALVALNTMFQAIAVTRGTQPIVNALNKANAKGSTKEASLLRWITGQVFEGAKIKTDTKTKKVLTITIKGIKSNQLILKNLNNVTVDKDNGGKTTIRTKDLKELISFDPSKDPVIKSITLEQKQKLAQNWIKARAEAWNMTEKEVKIFLGTL